MTRIGSAKAIDVRSRGGTIPSCTCEDVGNHDSSSDAEQCSVRARQGERSRLVVREQGLAEPTEPSC